MFHSKGLQLVFGMRRRLCIVSVLAFLSTTTLHAQMLWDRTPPNLTTWTDFDCAVSNAFDGVTNAVMLLPPGPWHVELEQGYRIFSPGGDLAAATNLFTCNMQFGVPTWPICVAETQTTPRAWISFAVGGSAFRTNLCPSTYAPTQWVQAAYGHSAPSYVKGTNIAKWYADRDRSRYKLGFVLVNSNDWPTFQTAVHAAATNAPPPATWVPSIPPNTAALAFVGQQTSPSGVNLWLYSPSNRPVAFLARPALNTPSNTWTTMGSCTAVSPFTFWHTSFQPGEAFFWAGYTDQDTDVDGIPDFLESYVYGTNPYSADSDNDGISDFDEIFVYGTDPNNGDTTLPSVVLTSPPNNLQLVWVP